MPVLATSPVQGWVSGSQRCILEAQGHGQAFPRLQTYAEAGVLAGRLRDALVSQGMTDVSAQAVPRGGDWAILTAYRYAAGGEAVQVRQLYLSRSGLLRTVTGSHAPGEPDACAGEMLTYLRELAE
ncbi:hypothetical protein ACFP81_10425 [Deinococcus lacus]|uniref:DUF1795 domain-containing protein n=1 Tax=Deinococcus lacus TaxID=392561 RepID=A0ABW1YDE8_9DEIO